MPRWWYSTGLIISSKVEINIHNIEWKIYIKTVYDTSICSVQHDRRTRAMTSFSGRKPMPQNSSTRALPLPSHDVLLHAGASEHFLGKLLHVQQLCFRSSRSNSSQRTWSIAHKTIYFFWNSFWKNACRPFAFEKKKWARARVLSGCNKPFFLAGQLKFWILICASIRALPIKI